MRDTGIGGGQRGLLTRGTRTAEDGVGKLDDASDTPAWVALKSSIADRGAEAPDSKVEGKDSSRVGGRERRATREKKEGVTKGERRGAGETMAKEELGTGLVDDGTGAVNVQDRVLIRDTEEARRNISESHLALMPHAT